MAEVDSMPAYAVYKLQPKRAENSPLRASPKPADGTLEKPSPESASKKTSSAESFNSMEAETLRTPSSKTASKPNSSDELSDPVEAKSKEDDGELLNYKTAGVFVSSKKKQRLRHALSEAIKKKKKKRQTKRILMKRSSAKELKVKVGRSKKGDRKEEALVDQREKKEQSSMEEMLEEQHMMEEEDHEEGEGEEEELDFEPFKNAFDQDSYIDSRKAARDLFSMLIKPLDVDLFFSESWEKRPVLLRRHQHQYNDGWFSTQELDSILLENYLEFSKNIDVTTYEDGVRKTHNWDGRATAPAVWDFYKNGCSVRLLNPQTYSKGVWLLTSTLQELFGSCMGANVYLTPPGSQGFAPHYDDIEAFVMQLEGKKLWKIYKERNEKDKLPRYSSANLTEEDLGEPSLEAVLEPGDLLYFPRGTIHQASTLGEQHSLHITLSTYQNNSWADLMEKLVPAALEVAIREDEEFRCGLPLDYLQHMGATFSDSSDTRRAEFFEKVSTLFAKLSNHAPIDAAVDQLGSNFMHGCLPPCTTPDETSQTSSVSGDKWENGHLVKGVELEGSTRVKLVRHGAVRLVVEKDGVLLFTTATNSRLNAARDKCGINIDSNEASGIDYLIQSYPNYVAIETIPLNKGSSLVDKIDFSYTLYLQGVLMIET